MMAGNFAQYPRAPRASFDFAAVNAAALPHLEALCRRWLPGGRRIGKEWICGSLRGEAGMSCPACHAR